jgi:3-dehydroquinate synthase class II
MISLRLLKEHDPLIRAKAEKEGKTIAAILDEAITLYLSLNP